jgi:Xaa-Pro aminopeptidase
VHDVIDIVGGAARRPFVAGTVFNVEPTLEIPDRKLHIRLEDTIVVTDRRGQPDGRGARGSRAAVRVDPAEGVNSAPLADRTSR